MPGADPSLPATGHVPSPKSQVPERDTGPFHTCGFPPAAGALDSEHDRGLSQQYFVIGRQSRFLATNLDQPKPQQATDIHRSRVRQGRARGLTDQGRLAALHRKLSVLRRRQLETLTYSLYPLVSTRASGMVTVARYPVM